MSDIAQGIASNFVTVFQDGLTTAIQTAANSYINTIATSYSIPSLNVALEFQGDFSLWPASNPNLVLYANGYFEVSQILIFFLMLSWQPKFRLEIMIILA